MLLCVVYSNNKHVKKVFKRDGGHGKKVGFFFKYCNIPLVDYNTKSTGEAKASIILLVNLVLSLAQ